MAVHTIMEKLIVACLFGEEDVPDNMKKKCEVNNE
jgi:hypothetical protein